MAPLPTLAGRATRFCPPYRASNSLLPRRRTARPESGLQGGNARLEGLVLLAGKPGHFLDGLEFLALDHIEVVEPALGLAAERRFDLAADALRDTGGIVHQPRHLVEHPVAGLGHRLPPNFTAALLCSTMAIAPSGCKA